MTTAIRLTDIRRVAIALGTTEERVERAANDCGVPVHRINSSRLLDDEGEQAIREYLNRQK